MDVKHQVFVSSTYKDLIEERKAVIHALLELDCIPAGMELFPATDEDAWSLIKEVIDGCDYYLLILAGKYGSAGPDGIGYTEMEFDYAVSVSKPVLAFIHEAPDKLTASNIEKTEAMQNKLAAFREKAKAKHCKFWTSPEDLGGKVSRSLVQLRKRHPSPGWVPGKFAASQSMLRELQELRTKVAQLELEAATGPTSVQADTEELAQGADLVEFHPKLKHTAEDKNGKETKVSCSWDKLLSYFGPNMLAECSDEEMMSRVKLAFYHSIPKVIRDFNSLNSLVLPYVLEDKIRVQFQALGYIATGLKKRAVADNSRYWRLTPVGEKHLISVRAERRQPNKVAA
ncbi:MULTISPECIES: DUF4062 domain-containing protein [Comamonas]|jgi:hypothetical protein|uniref:DUF4062 domain-containing protein n=1 Tax=Comamonas TaxID=283 RepID=UPI00237D4D99|nr:DUF4062 domain-containing protein [Comamonas aquatica]MDE1557368.1 DUF4062 domain-containing protein [Comamonas aquatica]